MAEVVRPGLRGVVAAESSLSRIDGTAGRLTYRGYAIDELATTTCYEEVLHLLWHGALPTREELESFRGAMARERALEPETRTLVADLAATAEQPMAALRTTVSHLSAADPDGTAGPSNDDANHRKARRIVAKLPTIVAAFIRHREDSDPVPPREDLGHAANFLYMLDGEAPSEVAAEVFDQALVLHADHGLNASTFSAMVTASTRSDLHSAVTSAVGTLKGDLHGGANQNVMRMLLAVDESDRDPVEWAEHALENDDRVPGFGHPVYEVIDPRATILRERSRELGEADGDPRWFEYGRAIEAFMDDRLGLAPNIDFYSAPTYYQLGIPVDLYTPIFAMARVGGWIGHVLEQWADNRVIRPRARYVGPDERPVPTLEERGD